MSSSSLFTQGKNPRLRGSLFACLYSLLKLFELLITQASHLLAGCEPPNYHRSLMDDHALGGKPMLTWGFPQNLPPRGCQIFRRKSENGDKIGRISSSISPQASILALRQGMPRPGTVKYNWLVVSTSFNPSAKYESQLG